MKEMKKRESEFRQLNGEPSERDKEVPIINIPLLFIYSKYVKWLENL